MKRWNRLKEHRNTYEAKETKEDESNHTIVASLPWYCEWCWNKLVKAVRDNKQRYDKNTWKPYKVMCFVCPVWLKSKDYPFTPLTLYREMNKPNIEELVNRYDALPYKEKVKRLIKGEKKAFKEMYNLNLTNKMISHISGIPYNTLIHLSDLKEDDSIRRYYEILKRQDFWKWVADSVKNLNRDNLRISPNTNKD